MSPGKALRLLACVLSLALTTACGDACLSLASQVCSCQPDANSQAICNQKAKDAEEERDLSTAKYHHYELASAAFQIGIVLASAAVRARASIRRSTLALPVWPFIVLDPIEPAACAASSRA